MKLDTIYGPEMTPEFHLIAESPSDQCVLEAFQQFGIRHKASPAISGPVDGRRVDTLKLYYPPLP